MLRQNFYSEFISKFDQELWNWVDSFQQSFHLIWQPGYRALLLASLPWYLSNSHGSISLIFMFTVKTVVHMLLIPNLEKCLVHPGIKHKNERGQAIFTALVINSKNKYTYKDVTFLIFALPKLIKLGLTRTRAKINMCVISAALHWWNNSK